MIIAISAKQGAGKTTTADALAAAIKSEDSHPRRVRFAAALYEMHDAIRPVLTKYGIERPAIDAPLLQILGTEYGRNIIGENVWVDCLMHFINNDLNIVVDLDEDIPAYIIDDMRFKNEFAAFDKFKDLPNFPILRVRLECDRDIRKARRGDKWRDNETHASEVDLDGYVTEGKFDLIVDTGVTPINEVVDQILVAMQTKINKQAINDALGEDDDNSTVSE